MPSFFHIKRIPQRPNRKGLIVDIYPRFNELKRPPVANVDQAMVVFAVRNPNPNLSILDRFLCLMKKQGIEYVSRFFNIALTCLWNDARINASF